MHGTPALAWMWMPLRDRRTLLGWRGVAESALSAVSMAPVLCDLHRCVGCWIAMELEISSVGGVFDEASDGASGGVDEDDRSIMGDSNLIRRVGAAGREGLSRPAPVTL